MLLVIYIDYDDFISKHAEIITKSLDNENPNVRHPSAVKSILEFIRDDAYYPEFIDKINHLVFSIATRQDFFAANKRTAVIAAGAYFLEINSFDQAVVDNFIRGMENPILLVARGELSKEDLKAVINDLIYNLELSEETKTRFIRLLPEN